MKLILAMILLTALSFTTQAQDEPETVRGKDLIEKIDRSEISDDEIDGSMILDDAVPKIEIQKIEFDKPQVKKGTNKKPAVKKSPKPVSKPQPNSGTVKKESNRKKILVSDRTIAINGLLKNDKIVVNDDNTYVYRNVKTNTVQYRFKGKVPTESPGLKVLSENRYMVEDVSLLKDSPSPKKVTKVENKGNADQVSESTNTKAQPKQAEPITKVSNPAPTNLTKVEKIKKKFENEYTRGNKITETITKDKLLKNDIVHISGEVQLVIRRNRNTYEMEYYWLPELLKLNTKALKSTPFRAMSNNRFKVIKDL